MKRFLSWILAAVVAAALVLTPVPGTVFAAESFGAGTAETAAESGNETADTGTDTGGSEPAGKGQDAGSSALRGVLI